MDYLEVSAKTVEEAIQLALQQLGVRREEVEVTVTKKGKAGIFGLGSEEATVQVRLKQPLNEQSNTTALAREVLEALLAKMKMPAVVEPARPPQEEAASAVVPITLDVKGEDLGILIGRRGQTLASMQYITNLIVSHRTEIRNPITIDVEGYRQRRYSALKKLAIRMAEQVKDTGRPITLEPMPANERRLVHLALANYPGVITESIGEGEERKITIQKKKE